MTDIKNIDKTTKTVTFTDELIWNGLCGGPVGSH